VKKRGILNIETIVGEVEDLLLPEGLDMVFIVNAFHEMANPVALLNNLARSLKPNASVVIIDRDPAKLNYATSHFLTNRRRRDLILGRQALLGRAIQTSYGSYVPIS